MNMGMGMGMGKGMGMGMGMGMVRPKRLYPILGAAQCARREENFSEVVVRVEGAIVIEEEHMQQRIKRVEGQLLLR